MEEPQSLNSADILDKLLLYVKMNPNKLARVLGLRSNVVLYHIKNGRNRISVDLAEKVVAHYPEINYEWLVRGRGPMLNEEKLKGHGFGGKANFEEILDNLPIDQIMTYIHKHEKARGFDKDETYKMFLEIRIQRKIIESLQAMGVATDAALSKTDEAEESV